MFQEIFHIVRGFFVSLPSRFFCYRLFNSSSIITSLILIAPFRDVFSIYSYISYCVLNLNVFSINSQSLVQIIYILVWTVFLLFAGVMFKWILKR